ncbi:YkuS family protein [Alkaliphilus peptidifermentans]|uniref:Uncharacterized protein family (UPF0180) n=1 Tax=Alkaliphilus peptidifermentans DSM 18978 TaxID=1120976 RepID=A0A1G5HTJ3_9FIRM|nr:YkuS family protein [Alkaliphilus peptidifermentans]SCY66348.1 Uncharacterised protein family (UPF0180) [Alkaliphilus peptidifermentans DSM 18978]
MKKKVVVENTLEDVKNYYSKQGYDVSLLYFDENINNINTEEYDAIIVNDINNSNLPRSVKKTGKVVEAMGLVPHQVFEKMNANKP